MIFATTLKKKITCYKVETMLELFNSLSTDASSPVWPFSSSARAMRARSFSPAPVPCVLASSYHCRRLNISQTLRSRQTKDKIEGLWKNFFKNKAYFQNLYYNLTSLLYYTIAVKRNCCDSSFRTARACPVWSLKTCATLHTTKWHLVSITLDPII